MSFANENRSLITQAIENELKKITIEHGGSYNTTHEAYAVLLEEKEEAEKELNIIQDRMFGIWNRIKNNKEILPQTLCSIYKSAINLSLEAIQVAAVTDFNIYKRLSFILSLSLFYFWQIFFNLIYGCLPLFHSTITTQESQSH